MMQVKMFDSNDRFEIHLTPETIPEAAMLVRLGLNATQELKLVETTAYRDGTFNTWVSIGQKKQANGTVKP